jgi:DNA modification methylase
MDYTEFLQKKIVDFKHFGFGIKNHELDPGNRPHQSDAIRWAADQGRAGLFMRFGTGKTRIQCQLAKIIHSRTGKRFLVVCPLAAKHQFIHEDGPVLGMHWQYVRTDEEAQMTDTPYLITNYERVRDGSLNPETLDLGGVSLDEGSNLRNMNTKTTQVFKQVFANVPYRYVATATPDPNNVKELLYFAEWLGVKDHGFGLTKWFKRNPKKAGDLRLIPAHEQEYWLWVASWALFLYAPSDLGYSDEGYDLPGLNVHWDMVTVDHTRAWNQVDEHGQRRMFVDAANGTSEAIIEARATLPERIQKMLEIIRENPGRNWLIWHDLEEERREIERVLPEAVTVYGSQKLEIREQRIMDFAHGKISMLATKPSIAGSGCNFQYHCYSNIFLSINYNFEDIIQAIHRTYRFQQYHDVDVHFVYADSQSNVVKAIQAKWAQYDKQVEKMRAIVRKYGLSHEDMHKDLERTIGVERMEHKSDLFTAVNNDCVAEVKRLASNSIHMIMTSIPFGNHYEYTTNVEDFGHNPSDEKFWEQMDYLIPDLLRVLMPGRIAGIHVKDRVLYGHQTASGVMEIEPFTMRTIFAFQKHGFLFHGYHNIITDVVRENSTSYRLGWSEMTKDSTKMGAGLPEWLLLFRKRPTSTVNAYADEPVKHSKANVTRARWQIDAHSLWRSNGNRLLQPEEYAVMDPTVASRIFAIEQLENPYDYERHVAICEALEAKGHLPKDFMLFPPRVTKAEGDGVWDDIVYMRTLNSDQSRRRVDNHICPLPLDIVARSIRLYSNPGELILDPFGGLGTTGKVAIEEGRRAYLIELSKIYYQSLVRYCKDAEEKYKTPTLWDYLNQVNQAQTVGVSA